MDQCSIEQKWNHLVHFGNNHIATPRWSKYPVRCFVVYEIGEKKGEFWERKRNTNELHLETKSTKQRPNHVEMYVIDKLNKEIKEYKAEIRESFGNLSINENVNLHVLITLYINVTPCLSCAESMISFKDSLEHESCKVKLKIVFFCFI